MIPSSNICRSTLMANRWSFSGRDVLLFCRGTVSIFYSPSQQDSLLKHLQVTILAGHHFDYKVKDFSATMIPSSNICRSTLMANRWSLCGGDVLLFCRGVLSIFLNLRKYQMVCKILNAVTVSNCNREPDHNKKKTANRVLRNRYLRLCTFPLNENCMLPKQ